VSLHRLLFDIVVAVHTLSVSVDMRLVSPQFMRLIAGNLNHLAICSVILKEADFYVFSANFTTTGSRATLLLVARDHRKGVRILAVFAFHWPLLTVLLVGGQLGDLNGTLTVLARFLSMKLILSKIKCTLWFSSSLMSTILPHILHLRMLRRQ
jgi:hypothetical protein